MTENNKTPDKFELAAPKIDLEVWDKIKSSYDQQSGEQKRMYQAKASKHVLKTLKIYPHQFLVAWQWNGCYRNQKKMLDDKKAQRLYDEITINGWNSDAA